MKFPEKHSVILGTVITAAGLRSLGRTAGAPDAVEVRVDALLAAGVSVDAIESALAARRLPVLLTLRIPAEGGHMKWQIAYRRELYLRLLPLVDAIDVELATVRAMKSAIEAAQAARKTIVYSAHAIVRPATPSQFAKWIGQFSPGDSSILKIAAQIKSWRDLQRLAGLLINHPDWSIAVMGLGPYAPQSRSVLTALGSRLVYGYLDKPAAPGQPSAIAVRKMASSLSLAR